MKTDHLAALAPLALKMIEKIEIEMKENSGKSHPQQLATPSLTESIQPSLQKAREICQSWTQEFKSVPAEDLFDVADFFLIRVSRMIAQQEMGEPIFQAEEKLLNLADAILEGNKSHPDLVLVQLKSNYYRALVYMTHREDQVDTIISYLTFVEMFQSDQVFACCRQIQMLDTLSVSCTSWMNSDWKREDQEKISGIATQITHKMMDIYEGVPASCRVSGWNRVVVYGNLVSHALGLALRHFVEVCHAPKRAWRYRVRVENLLTRLQQFLNRHQSLSPRESECELVLSLLIHFLKALRPEDGWLRQSLINIARDFAPDRVSSQILMYRTLIAAFAEPDKQNKQNLILMEGIGVEKKLSIQDKPSPTQSESEEEHFEKKYPASLLLTDEKDQKNEKNEKKEEEGRTPNLKTDHLAALAPQMLDVIEKIDAAMKPKMESQKTFKKTLTEPSLTEPMEEKQDLQHCAQMAKPICESWLDKSPSGAVTISCR